MFQLRKKRWVNISWPLYVVCMLLQYPAIISSFEKVKYSDTGLRVFGLELIPVSWQSAHRWLVINSAVAAVTFHQARSYFPSQRDHPLGQYQIIQLGGKGTMVPSQDSIPQQVL